MLLPASNMTLAFVTNDGDIEGANAAFAELAQELSASQSGVKLTDAEVK